jgi:hypothetical protein
MDPDLCSAGVDKKRGCKGKVMDRYLIGCNNVLNEKDH